MAQLRMNAEEWRKVIEGLDHTPEEERDPHWRRARDTLHEFLAPMMKLRRKAGDPRRDVKDVVCSFCAGAITPGHNYVFEPSSGASSHAKCWLKGRA